MGAVYVALRLLLQNDCINMSGSFIASNSTLKPLKV